MKPGTPAYASAAIKDLWPTPAHLTSYVDPTPVSDYLANRSEGYSIPAAIGLAAIPFGIGGLLGKAVKSHLGKKARDAYPGLLADDPNALMTAIASGYPEVAEQGISVYHSTPNIWTPEADAPLGKFKLEKMGTGEGAQVRGWGGYFAENPKTAEDYYNKFGSENYKYGAKLIHPKNEFRSPVALTDYYAESEYKLAAEKLKKHKGNYAEALDDLYNQAKERGYVDKNGNFIDLGDEGENFYQEAAAYLKDWRDEGLVYKGPEAAMYKFELPDEIVPGLLDLDAAFSAQPEAIQKLPLSHIKKGEDLQKRLLPLIGGYNKEAVSNFLQTLGVPGNKFLDQGSRQTGDLPYFVKLKGLPHPLPVANKRNADMMALGAKTKIEDFYPAPPGTHNFVIWDQGLLNEMPAIERLK